MVAEDVGAEAVVAGVQRVVRFMDTQRWDNHITDSRGEGEECGKEGEAATLVDMASIDPNVTATTLSTPYCPV